MRKGRPKKTNEPGVEGNVLVTDDAAGPSASPPVNGKGKVQSADVKSKEAELPFWEFLSSQGDRWATDGIELYIYRVWPVIDKGETDHYIATLREPIDEEYLLSTFGSGRYLLILRDARRKLVRKHTFSIHN